VATEIRVSWNILKSFTAAHLSCFGFLSFSFFLPFCFSFFVFGGDYNFCLIVFSQGFFKDNIGLNIYI
jgi:hypothetical protein